MPVTDKGVSRLWRWRRPNGARAMVLLVVLGWFAASCGSAWGEEPSLCGPAEGQVVRVLDGDTVELGDGQRVRYLLIDAPEIAHHAGETSDCFGDEARALNETLVTGRSVGLEYDEACTDRYGRLLAYVTVGDRMVNWVMVERGYARVLVIAPNGRYADQFYETQFAARSSAAGLWGQCVTDQGSVADERSGGGRP